MKKNLIALFGATAALGIIAGCGGSTGGGDATDSGGGPVYGGGSQSGSISIDLNESSLDVASTTGFTVSLTGANGSASVGTRITCDSEDGVAIIEPSTGAESTDSKGEISGRIGCEAPGSYRLVCKLPGAGARSTTVTVRCSGTEPNGFDGFPGAAGGGLGGGNGGGITDFDSSKVKITSVVFEDAGNKSGAIDTSRDSDCDDDPATTGDSEPFTDTTVTFTITNTSGQTVNLSSFSYVVPDFPTTADYDSPSIFFTGNNGLTIASGESGQLVGFFTTASPSNKKFIGSSTNISDTLGFRNISFTVSGATDNGEDFTVKTTAGASIQAYNNCD